MNKSEILHKRFFLLYEQENIELCMQEYADQEMIAFANWVHGNAYKYIDRKQPDNTWLIKSENGDNNILTDQELLIKYKEDNEK